MREHPPLSRRALLSAAAASAAAAALPAPATAQAAAKAGGGPALGLVIHSFPVRAARERRGGEPISPPARFLAHARSLGAGGVQVGLGALSEAEARALRDQAGAASMFLEGVVSLPRGDSGLPKFTAEVRAAKLAGAEVVRTVMLSGRRYETFPTAAAFRRFAGEAEHALALAAPVVAREGVLLAVENHKDFRADELTALLKRVGNDHVGVCLDTGNSIALLEDPTEVVEALAPLAFTTHFKDMGVESSRDGFLLSEVPLGAGLLDLPGFVKTLRAARPGVRFNIEMITRDPLSIPCLSDRYWATLADLPARHLAHTLAWVRDHPPARPLDRVSSLPPDAQLRLEDENVRRCIEFAHERLGLDS